MQFLGCCSWFQGYLYAGVRAVCRKAWLVVARMLLGCCRRLPGCCYAVYKVLRVIATTLVCGCLGVVADWQGIFMRELG